MRKGFFYMIFIAVMATAHAQRSPSDSEAFVRALKGSTLLVRLPEFSLQLNALRSRGDSAAVEALLRERDLEHKEILLSFTHTFDFCPVYFFYSRHSDAIRAGQMTGILRDHEGLPIPADKLPKQYFTAEFGATPQLNIEGFIVMDDQLLPLSEPLPFYVREYAWFGLKQRSKAEMLARYNRRLWGIYEYYE